MIKLQGSVQQRPRPVKKYNVSYGQNGDIYYGTSTIGNVFTTNIGDIGENAWLEGWANHSGVQLAPNSDWKPTQANVAPLGDDEPDVAEKSLMSTFGASDKDRFMDRAPDSILGDLQNLLPLNANTSVRGLDEVKKWQSSKSGYGKGFEPETLNPFFRN